MAPTDARSDKLHLYHLTDPDGLAVELIAP